MTLMKINLVDAGVDYPAEKVVLVCIVTNVWRFARNIAGKKAQNRN